MPPWATDILAAAQIAGVALALLRGKRGLKLAVAAGVFCLGAALLLAMPGQAMGLAVGGLLHALAYAWLLAWFATSLRRGREPVVTGFARRMRPTMPFKVVLYTRRVTLAWCGFFAAQMAISAVLLMAAPEAVWSAFVNLANLPLIAAMTLGEYGCRRVLFRHEQRTSLAATLMALRQFRSARG